MIDALISCPYGYNEGMEEWVQNGFEHLLRKDDLGNVIGISEKFNPLYRGVPDFNTPSIVYLRGEDGLMTALLAATWTKSKLLVQCNSNGEWVEIDVGGATWETIWTRLRDNAEALAEYVSYPDGAVPEFLEDGITPNPQFLPTVIVDIEGVPTELVNPQYEPFRMIGCWT